MAHTALGGDADEREIDTPIDRGPSATGRGTSSAARRTLPEGRASAAGSSARSTGDGVRLWIGAGRKAGIRPGDLVGAITGEAGLPSSVLGGIEIRDTFSLVEVPELHADEIVAALKKSSIRGKRVTIRRDRDS
jgi:ATP-dependent RNA helicase DeaD